MNSIFVTGIRKGTTEHQIIEFFGAYGHIMSLDFDVQKIFRCTIVYASSEMVCCTFYIFDSI